MRRIFAKFDVDGNGTLNRKELQRATAILGDKFSAEDIDVLMEILDKDQSDTVDMEEFIQAFMNKRRWKKFPNAHCNIDILRFLFLLSFFFNIIYHF